MHKTAWTSKGSLTSDRIPSPQRSSSPSKGKGKQKEPPKSKEARRIEGLISGLKSTKGKEKDPRGGCFCQARTHPLSPYTPICRQCGLILCSVNLPHFACPHCASSLLSQSARESLISTLETELSGTFLKEEQERQRAAEEARRAAGAFPALGPLGAHPSGATANSTLDAHPVNQTYKVMSLNSKTNRVKVSSYSTSPAAVALPSDRKGRDTPEDEPLRQPRPPAEVYFSTKEGDSDRPSRLRGDNVTYVPAPKTTTQSGSTARAKKSTHSAATHPPGGKDGASA